MHCLPLLKKVFVRQVRRPEGAPQEEDDRQRGQAEGRGRLVSLQPLEIVSIGGTEVMYALVILPPWVRVST